MSQIWAGATDFLTVAGSHLFGSKVQEISGCINTLCIILYKTAPTWLHIAVWISAVCHCTCMAG